MNHLAHIYLSGDDDGLKIGNFIADSVKGKAYLKYPEAIQKGILLHRKIDEFTDSHPIARKSASKFSARFGLYSGVIVDMVYDHFLAANWKDYHSVALKTYSEDFYTLLEENFDQLPARVQGFYPYMVEANWLLMYSTLTGIEEILFQMNRRVKRGVQLHLAVDELRENYSSLETEFRDFFRDLEGYVLKIAN